MGSFYQSDQRLHIQKNIFKKPHFQVDIGGTTYTGFAKFAKRLGVNTARYMVYGVELPQTNSYAPDIMKDISHIKRDFGASRGDVFFQIGITTPIDTSTTKSTKTEEKQAEIIKKHKYIAHDLLQRYRLHTAWREHMPQATIIIPLRPEEQRQKQYSSSGKRYLNKAKHAKLKFSIATKKQREEFYNMRYAMAYEKGFSIITKTMFIDLMEDITHHASGNLYIATKNKEIVSGSIMIYNKKQLVYLYGATNRQFGNIGAHYRLMDNICERGHQEGYTSCDLLGITPARGSHNHELQGVTRFKQAFGGKTHTYIGNYDLICNKLLYKTFKYIKS